MLSVKKLESLIIEPTNCCNLKCGMCPLNSSDMNMTRKRGFMDFGLFKKILDETPGINRLSLNNWGESLLHPKILEMIAYAREKGITKLLLCTNGTLLDEEKIRKLVAYLNVMEFSIDGPRERYEMVRGASYEELEKKVMRTMELKKMFAKNMDIGVVMVSSGESEKESFLFRRYWADKVDYVKIQPVLEKKQRKNYCSELWGTIQGRLVVLWDGIVVPCCVDYDGSLNLGNAWEDRLDDLWLKSPYLEALRYGHAKGEFLNVCGMCCDSIENKFLGKTISSGM